MNPSALIKENPLHFSVTGFFMRNAFPSKTANITVMSNFQLS